MSPLSAKPPTTTRAPEGEAGPPYRRGVGLVIFNATGLVFCAERRDTPGAWQMPQGGIHQGEEPRAAALRELREEIGTDAATIIGEHPQWLRYDFPDFLASTAFRGKYRGQEQKWFALRFTGVDTDVRLHNEHQDEPPEFVRWRWERLSALPSLIVDFKRPVYEILAADFAGYAVPERP